jgi:uncharacterized damage-inducible protein DinB
MARMVALTLFVVFASQSANGQTTDAGYENALSPSLANVAKAMHAAIRRNLAEAAEAMPAAEYNFRPTAQVRTFGQLVGHLVMANFIFCSPVKGEKAPIAANYEQMTDKAALVKALNESLTYCDEAYAATTDANYSEPVTVGPAGDMGPAKTVRGAALMWNVAHNNEHYGNIVVYMRLKGHVPPSTARATEAAKK